MTKWSYELNEYDLDYQPRTSIKAQALADFPIETPHERKENKVELVLHMDGSTTDKHAGGGVILTNQEGEDLYFAIRYEETLSNNETKDGTLLVGMRIALENGV
ncbi:UNVERIFIED_CONTAM: hypothetical protein Sangu_0399800 [Sesamum angustifolium]|uniref:RNase H type-1 domain-containing protein n=1 Tax=Sesamum angustifolium TaxID=2727405 RepID=A0AAW2QT72_9LAMI